jgi:mono/diheme cytochrome c family protein
MARRFFWARVVLVLLSWVPFALVGRARSRTSPKTPVHFVPDMDDQDRYDPQDANPAFADGRAMRPAVPGTVARGELRDDVHYHGGKVPGPEGDLVWAAGIPAEVDEELMEQGRDGYETFCRPCHGSSGDGNGMVAVRADQLQEGTWTPPSSMHTDLVRERPDGHLYNTVTNGIRNMPAYGPQIPEEERWAIVAYVRALQRSQNATLDDVPEDEREGLR